MSDWKGGEVESRFFAADSFLPMTHITAWSQNPPETPSENSSEDEKKKQLEREKATRKPKCLVGESERERDICMRLFQGMTNMFSNYNRKPLSEHIATMIAQWL